MTTSGTDGQMDGLRETSSRDKNAYMERDMKTDSLQVRYENSDYLLLL